ncbi:MAG: L-histidine N(alpha)-methyltransferase [Gemmatimonadota bacterium]
MMDLPSLRKEVAASLARTPPHLPPKLFYDERGAHLFEKITRLPEYYPTRTELGILRTHLPEMSRPAGPGVRLVEFGSGSGEKTELLLESLEQPTAYIPVDIAREQLNEVAARLDRRFPGLQVLPLAADYTQPFHLPEPRGASDSGRGRPLLFFPGSTLGNFEPQAAQTFLAGAGSSLGPGAALILGVDLEKSPELLLPAYDDARGVTAEFNRNSLVHLNRLLGTDFRPDAFEHRAVWNQPASRMEMHLVALQPQTVTLPAAQNGSGPRDDQRLDFKIGEHIVTEHSYKYTPQSLQALTTAAGWKTVQSWTDANEWFLVRFLEWKGPPHER